MTYYACCQQRFHISTLSFFENPTRTEPYTFGPVGFPVRPISKPPGPAGVLSIVVGDFTLSHTHTNLQRHTQTHTGTQKHTNTQTHRDTHKLTHTHAHTHTNRHTKTHIQGREPVSVKNYLGNLNLIFQK